MEQSAGRTVVANLGLPWDALQGVRQTFELPYEVLPATGLVAVLDGVHRRRRPDSGHA